MSQPGNTAQHGQVWLDEETGIWQVRERTMDVNPWNVKIREVCGDCNTLVLNNRVELPVEQVLLAMMKAEAVELAAEDATRVATWAAKTAMMRSLQDSGPRAIPRNHFAYLRQNLQPPPHTLIWAGRAEAPPDTWTRHLRFWYLPEGEEGRRARCHSTTLILGELMLLVVGSDDEISFRALQEAAAIVRGPAWSHLWPSVPDALSWPPPATLTPENAVFFSAAIPHWLGLA